MFNIRRSFAHWYLGGAASVVLTLAPVLPASADVGTSGQPSHSFNFAAPPGLGGLAPEIAISYSGPGPIDYLPYGWRLSGISAITRCSATKVVDGRVRGVQYDRHDKLCLDGARLVPMNVKSGSPVTGYLTADASPLGSGYKEYRTESDPYARVRANGTDGSGTGPLYFRVWTKAGRVMDFGNGPASDGNTNANVGTQLSGASAQLSQAWLISQIRDVAGNAIAFKYIQSNRVWGTAATGNTGHEWVPAEIQYGANKVVFSYEDRPVTTPLDGREQMHLDVRNVYVKRLTSITSYINSANSGSLGPSSSAVAVRTVKLGYTNGPVTKRSLLASIQECAGSGNASCLPSTTFTYSPGSTAYVPSNRYGHQCSWREDSPQPTSNGLVGDFDGDGKSDILSSGGCAGAGLPMPPVMYPAGLAGVYFSNGDETFRPPSVNSGLPTVSDGCIAANVGDFNGDGKSDILWAKVAGDGCSFYGPPRTVLYLSNGDGTFSATQVTGVTLNASLSNVVDNITLRSWSEGNSFYLLDIDGDGLLDIVTTILPAVSNWIVGSAAPNPCANMICTHVYKGNGAGQFTEVSNTGLEHWSLFSDSPKPLASSGAVADFNADGLQDLVASPDQRIVMTNLASLALSMGNGTFVPVQIPGGAICDKGIIDYNGDGQPDCIGSGPVAGQEDDALSVMDNRSFQPTRILKFNDPATGFPYYFGYPGAGGTGDFNGDGRSDVTYPGGVLYSNGDGSFTADAVSGPSLGLPAGFIPGNFLGYGNTEFIDNDFRQTDNAVVSNSYLWVKSNNVPPDLLVTVVSPTKSATEYTYVSLAHSTLPGDAMGPRYIGNAALVPSNAATYPDRDLAPQGWVVARETLSYSATIAPLVTEYAYAGLRASNIGRGSYGFREVRIQRPAADGGVTTHVTTYMQKFPYVGQELSEQLYNAPLNTYSSSNLLKTTRYVYCDAASPAGADVAAIQNGLECPLTSVLARPYRVFSQTFGVDLDGSALPTISTQVSGFTMTGDPLQVTTTNAGPPISPNTYSSSATNQYYPDNTTCPDAQNCNWILGRVQRSIVRGTAPDAPLVTNSGTGGTATVGTGVTPPIAAPLTGLAFGNVTIGTSSTLAATLTNSSGTSMTFTVPSQGSVSGAGFTFASTSCVSPLAAFSSCAVSVTFTPVAGSSYAGSLVVSTGAGVLTGTLSGTGLAPSVIFQPASTNWGVVGAASDSGDWPQIMNNGLVAVRITAHSVANGPAGVWSWQGAAGYCIPGTTVLQPGQACSTFFGTSNLSTSGAYSAVEQISYQAVGGNGATFTAQQSYAFSVATTTANATGLAFGSTTVNTTSATRSFVLTNNAINGGSLKNLSIFMIGSQAANFPVTHSCGSTLAQGANCTVTVSFNPTSVTNGFSAAVQVQGGYSRMQAGVDSGLTQYPSVNFTVPVSGDGVGVPNPTLTASPTYFYGQTNTNTSPVGAFTVSFSGPATGLSVTATVGSIINNTCAVSQTSSCGFSWTTPSGKSSVSGTITVTATNGANVLAIPVSRTYGGEPDTAIATLTSPPSLSIPATWFGAGASSVAVTYRNDGTLPLNMGSSALVAPLSITANGCSNVAPGNSCSMTVSLATNVAGLNQSQTFKPSGADSGPAPVTVVWNVYSAIPRWSTTSMNLGTVALGGSTSQGITLFNDGNVAYNWAANNTVANLPAGYSFNTGACSNVSPGGGNCAVTVTFTPPGVGTYGGTNLYMAAASQVANSLSVTAVGATSGLVLSSCSSGGSSTSPVPMQQSCILGNIGTAPASVTYSTSLAGGSATGPASCAASTANCGTVVVTSPTAPGAYSGTVTATPNVGAPVTSGTLNLTVNTGSLTLTASPAFFDGETTTNNSPAESFSISFSGTATGLSVTTNVGIIKNNTCVGPQTNFCSFIWTTKAGKSTESGTITVSAANGSNILSIPVSRTYVSRP